MRKTILLTAFLVSSACAHQPARPPVQAPGVAAPPEPTPVPAGQLVDHEGDSMMTAVAVPGDAPNDGLDFAYNWIFDRYGRFRKKSGAVGNSQGRRYEVLTVEFPDGAVRVIYFDITEAWNNWKPAKK